MPGDKIVLTYFDSRGRAELARLIMAAGGIDYEDKRITGEEWEKLKPSEKNRKNKVHLQKLNEIFR